MKNEKEDNVLMKTLNPNMGNSKREKGKLRELLRVFVLR